MADEKAEPAADAAQAESGATPAASKKSGMLLLIIVSFVVMILTPILTVVVVSYMNKPAPDPEKTKKASPTADTIADIDAVVVNIPNTQATRFLRVAVHLRVSPPELAEMFKEKKAVVKDKIISAIGNKSLAALDGENGKEDLKKDIKQRMNAIITEYGGGKVGTVLDVYFSEYLIQ